MSAASTPSSVTTPASTGMDIVKAQASTAISEFKQPMTSGGLRRKHKPKILTEERYIEEMSKIIQRDFFPDLEKLRAQNDYLEAESRNDYLLMSQIRARYSLGRTTSVRSRRNNAMSPATFETPVHTNSGMDTNFPSTPVVDTPRTINSERSTLEGGTKLGISSELSLDAFLHNYTSEDNHSFQEIIETADEKLRQKYAVLFQHEQLSADQLCRALTLPSIEQQFAPLDPLRTIETWRYTNVNSVMYVPDGVEMTDDERIKAVSCKQSIQHAATRLSNDPLAAAAPGKKDDDSALAATPLNASNTPRANGFELLRSPSPRPGVAFSPIMTWGEIDGTPFRLDGGDTPRHNTPGPSFHINENSRRENIAIALAEKVSEKMRAQKQQALNTARRNIGSPFARTGYERLASMSPAAQRLATGKLGLRSTPLMLTPSPNVKRNTTASMKRRPSSSLVRSAVSPAVGKSATVKRNSSGAPIDPGSTLTDDLLQIPTKHRSSAADFF